MKIIAKQIITKQSILKNKVLETKDDLIINILEEQNIIKPKDENYIDLSNYTLISGLIDIHTHGCNGFSTMGMTTQSIINFSNSKIIEGVTSFCPTTVTSTIETTSKIITSVDLVLEDINLYNQLGAKIIGVFLEGPYISKQYKGAHDENLIKEIKLDDLKELIGLSKNIKSIIIAPELTNAIDAIKYLVDNNINVRLGHSNATAAITNEAIKIGANVSVHTYNTMKPLNHRESSIISEVLLNDNIYAEIICDLVHVNKDAIKILLKLKNLDKIILITDSISASGLQDGNYKLGNLDVVVDNKVARLTTGELAGSTLKLIDAVKIMNKDFNIPLIDAVNMATINPAKALSIDNKIGSIEINKKADLVAIDDDFDIVFVMVDGIVKYTRG